MFRRKDKNQNQSAGTRLGLAISAPITTVKNNSEIIYMASENDKNNANNKNSSNSFISHLPPSIPPPQHPSQKNSSSFMSGSAYDDLTSSDNGESPQLSFSPTSPGGLSPFTPPSRGTSFSESVFVDIKNSMNTNAGAGTGAIGIGGGVGDTNNSRFSSSTTSSFNSRNQKTVSTGNRRTSDVEGTTNALANVKLATTKLDELSLIEYIDLSTSASNVQIIATTGRFPPWLQRCTSLQYLIAKNLDVSIIDEWVSTSLINLKVVRLNNNKISTWPDHVARLMPEGKLQVLDLEGNPCLTSMFKKSSAFKGLYIEAALSQDTSRNGKETLSSSLLTSQYDLVLKKTRSATSGSRASSVNTNKQSLFSMRGKMLDDRDSILFKTAANGGEGDEEEDDDMLTSLEPKARPPPTSLLRKHSSATGLFSSFRNNNKNVLVLNKSQKQQQQKSHNKYDSEDSTIYSTDSLEEEKLSNMSMEKAEIAKTRVILCFLQDLHELANRNIVVPPISTLATTHTTISSIPEESISVLSPPRKNSLMSAGRPDSTASSSSTSSSSMGSSRTNSYLTNPTSSEASLMLQPTAGTASPAHRRLNSLDVLQHYLEEVGSNNPPKRGPKADVYYLLQKLEDFIESEKSFVSKLNEFSDIYIVEGRRESERCSKIFTHMPDLLQLHEDIVLPTLSASIERVKRGHDNQVEFFSHSLLSIMDGMDAVYVNYAKVCETSMRQARTWLKLFRQTILFYAAPYPGYVPTQHPDTELGEWLRECAKSKSHSLGTIIDYLQLPLDRLQEYKIFFSDLMTLFPNSQPIFTKVDILCREVAYWKPLQIREKRYTDLLKIFKLPANSGYGDFICDASVIVQSRIFFNQINISKGRPGDVMYLPQESDKTGILSDRKIPKCADFQVNDINRPPKGAHFRMIVFQEAVLLVIEGKRTVARVLLKKRIRASLPWRFHRVELIASSTDNSIDGSDSNASSLDTRMSMVPVQEVVETPLAISQENTLKPGIQGAPQTADQRYSLDRTFRLAVHESSELWYLSIRTFTGDRVAGTLKENRNELVQAITPEDS